MSDTSQAGLVALAERVEAATGPDRDLNAAIHTLVIGAAARAVVSSGRSIDFWPSWDTGLGMSTPLDFTGSVEGAEHALPGPDWPEWQITRRCATGYHANVGLGNDGVGCETPALALCAAALRARAAQKDHEHEQ